MISGVMWAFCHIKHVTYGTCDMVFGKHCGRLIVNYVYFVYVAVV